MEKIIEDLSLDDNYSIIEKDGKISLFKGDIHYLDNLSELEQLQIKTKNKIIFITPFCLAGIEQGYDVKGDEKIIALEVIEEITSTKEEILKLLPDTDINFKEIKTDISDGDFGKLVTETKNKISDGEVNQLIISREFSTEIDLNNEKLLSIFKKLLMNNGQYMTFLFNTPKLSFAGASPEKHLSIEKNKVIMNPIAGTFPKLEEKSFYERFINFLEDTKEIGELSMVIDEELKMISKITNGGTIEVPILKEVGAVIHTEATLEGFLKENISIIDAFKETMYAPTLVGGPLESAFGQISNIEKNSREYYGGAFGIYDTDFLDTAITIRTAFIDKLQKILKVRAGAGIVKDSEPENETRETKVKAEGFFGAIKKGNTSNKTEYLNTLSSEQKQEIIKLLEKRKLVLSDFYLKSHNNENLEVDKIKGKKFILINNGDDFVNLSGYMIEKMGGKVDIVSNKDFDVNTVDNYNIILIGPGYGNINDLEDKKMIKLLDFTEKLIKSEKKVLGICLGHQAICKVKGFDIEKQKEITQGEQIKLGFSGNKELLGFYNSFSPVHDGHSNGVDLSYKNRVLNYREKNISSTQSHPESIMSINGFEILKNMILELLKQ